MVESIDENPDPRVWLQARNDEWSREKGEMAMYYVSRHEGRIYFFNEKVSYPDCPDAWYTFESIGSWSPRSKTFAWSCANETNVQTTSSISKKTMEWMASKTGRLLGIITDVESVEQAWFIVAVAAKLSNAIAVYKNPTHIRDLSENDIEFIKSRGYKPWELRKNRIYHNEFIAITSGKNVIKK